MFYRVRPVCHIYLDIHLDIHLNVYLNIHLNVYLNIYLNVHLNLYLTLHPSHLTSTSPRRYTAPRRRIHK